MRMIIAHLPRRIYGELSGRRLLQDGAEKLDSLAKTVLQRYLRLPSEKAARLADVGAALFGIVLRQRLEDDGGLDAGETADALGEFKDGELQRVAEVDRVRLFGKEQTIQAIHEIRDITEASRLLALAADGERLAAESLIDK